MVKKGEGMEILSVGGRASIAAIFIRPTSTESWMDNKETTPKTRW